MPQQSGVLSAPTRCNIAFGMALVHAMRIAPDAYPGFQDMFNLGVLVPVFQRDAG